MLCKKTNIQTSGAESAVGLYSAVDAGSLPYFKLRQEIKKVLRDDLEIVLQHFYLYHDGTGFSTPFIYA